MQARASDHGRSDLVFCGGAPDIEGMRKAIASAGCLVVRNLFDPDGLAEARARAVLAATAWDFMVARGYTKGHEEFIAGAYAAGHIPAVDIDPEQTKSEIMIIGRYSEIASELFGEVSYGYALRRSMLAGKANPLAFHQDGFFSAPGYNFWTPLNDAGVTAPGLEVVIGSGGPVLSHNAVRADISRYIVQRYGEQSLWHPEVRVGDALVFTTFLMHRTYWLPSMSEGRYSLEIRGPIGRPIPIAGVSEEHWSMSPLLSIEASADAVSH